MIRIIDIISTVIAVVIIEVPRKQRQSFMS